jgi:hypothetical protein
MAAPFCRQSWSKDFETLGISSDVIEIFHVRLLEFEALYSASIVWGILSSERIRTIAGWVLKTETAEYSIEWLRNDAESEERDQRENEPGAEKDENQEKEDAEEEKEDDGLSEDFEEELWDSTWERISFLKNVHGRAAAAGITVWFLGAPPMTQNPIFVPPFTSVEDPAQDKFALYHGCAVQPTTYDLDSRLSSFLRTGPIIWLPENQSESTASYLSTRPACYYSTSLTYARLWPKLKDGLQSYRRERQLGDEYSVVAMSQIPGTVFNGNTPSITCARIPQNNPQLAKEPSSTNFHRLMLVQFANRNTAERRSDRRKPIHKNNPNSAHADIITSPLPIFEQHDLSSCLVGQTIHQMTPVEHVTMVAGCTDRGAEHIASGVVCYLVYGFGEGMLGAGAEEDDWGSAFTVNPPKTDPVVTPGTMIDD